MTDRINVTKSSMPDFQDYVDEIKSIWENHWLTNNGPKHQKFEQLLKQYLEISNVALFTNGHSGLENIISAMGLKGEVITTPFTFASTTNAIVRNGLEPVFCDINSEDYTIDVNKIEQLITEKTSAIIPVHVYGNVCDVKAIDKIAKKYNLKVIYDAAHVFGTKIDGIGIANFGDASMFSFHATKVFNTIEGGAVVFKDENLYEKLNHLKNFGITSQESVEYVGGNAKMNEFQAAMGICNLKNIEQCINKRKVVVDKYIKRLDGIKGIKVNKTPSNVKSNNAYFPVVFDGYKLSRDEVLENLAKENIFARKYFYPITSEFEAYQNKFEIQKTPIAKKISENVLTLPLYPDLSLEDVDRICDIILGE